MIHKVIVFLGEEEAKKSKDKKQEAVLGKSWRDLIPVIKMEVSSVSFIIYFLSKKLI